MRDRCLVLVARLGLLFVCASSARELSAQGFLPFDDPDVEDAPLYLGQYTQGLYGNSDEMPEQHYLEGIERANSIVPLGPDGNPDPVNGKIIMLSIGMSNTAGQWCNLAGFTPVQPGPQGYPECYGWTAVGRMRNSPGAMSPFVFPVHGAFPAQTAFAWVDDTAGPMRAVPPNPAIPDFQGNWTRLRLYVFPYYTPTVTEAMIQVIWLKQLNPAPTVSLPAANSDAYSLEERIGRIVRYAKSIYPNLKMVFFTSAAYRGYNTNGFGPEPMGFESGFGPKLLIDAQMAQMQNGGNVVDPVAGDLNYDTEVAPWLAWGPYWYADGPNGRASDGLAWHPDEFLSIDFVHLELPGNSKNGLMIFNFFMFSPFTHCWFSGDGPCG
jgi:hypothetical protein